MVTNLFDLLTIITFGSTAFHCSKDAKLQMNLLLCWSIILRALNMASLRISSKTSPRNACISPFWHALRAKVTLFVHNHALRKEVTVCVQSHALRAICTHYVQKSRLACKVPFSVQKLRFAYWVNAFRHFARFVWQLHAMRAKLINCELICI